MNKYSYITDKYLKNNKKNVPYYIIIFCLKIFSLIAILSIIFLNFYYNYKISNNDVSKTFIVNIGKNDKNDMVNIFSNINCIENYKEINSNYNSNNEIINTSYKITIDDLKNTDSFVNEMNNYNVEVIISNENVSFQSSYKVLIIFFIILSIVYSFILVLFIHVCHSFFKKESNSIKILYFLGYKKKDILKLIMNFINKLKLVNILVQIICIIAIISCFEIFKIFFGAKYLLIFLSFVINDLIYYITGIFLIKLLIRNLQ